jgi:hypothetical protein
VKKKRSSKSITKQLDDLWAEAVKIKAHNKCEMCGRITYLNSHHIFSRSNYSVRWDVENGVCLCAGHHVLCNDSAHKAPADFIEWIKGKRGGRWYGSLRRRAKAGTCGDKEKILGKLKGIITST